MTDESASALKTAEDSVPAAAQHAEPAEPAKHGGPIEHAKQAIKDAVEKVVEKLPGGHAGR
ncbi:MAG: hypothetical protein ACLP8S_31185 [Solirubrobacteraceae bacterium]